MKPFLVTFFREHPKPVRFVVMAQTGRKAIEFAKPYMLSDYRGAQAHPLSVAFEMGEFSKVEELAFGEPE